MRIANRSICLSSYWNQLSFVCFQCVRACKQKLLAQSEKWNDMKRIKMSICKVDGRWETVREFRFFLITPVSFCRSLERSHHVCTTRKCGQKKEKERKWFNPNKIMIHLVFCAENENNFRQNSISMMTAIIFYVDTQIICMLSAWNGAATIVIVCQVWCEFMNLIQWHRPFGIRQINE